ncbi:MAG: hypothetical protein K6T55_08000 [Syntrophobacterales bacterium]|nr:hypothetical protein [Syntrophobacterales bacterium]
MAPPPTKPPATTAVPPGSSPGVRRPTGPHRGPGTPSSPPLRYQQAAPPAAGPAAPQNPSGAKGAPASGSAKGSPPPAASGGAGASPPASGPKPPASPSETYSRLKAAKEALEYYTSGNGRFVKDRDAQIEKLRREIGFLEKYQQGGGGASGAATKKTPAGPTPPSGGTAGSTSRSVSPPAQSPPPVSSRGGVVTAPGPGGPPPPTGRLKVYDQKGVKTGEKPYWGSGTPSDPYRDYPEVNKPFGDRIWGSGTRTDPYRDYPDATKPFGDRIRGSGTPSDPYTNTRPPAVLPEPGGPPVSRGGAGVTRGVQAGAGVPPPGKPSGASAPTRDRAAEKKRDRVVTGLLDLEKQWEQKVTQLEMGVDKWHDRRRADAERRLKHLEEGMEIIGGKISRMAAALDKAKERGDWDEVKRRENDAEKLLLMHTLLWGRINTNRESLENEPTERARDKEWLKNVWHSFQEENQRLLELGREDPDAALSILNRHHSSKWNPKALDNLFQYESSGEVSPLVTPTSYHPATEKSKVEKGRWREERKAQIERDYDDRITRVMNEPVDSGAQGTGAALGKHHRLEELHREKEARQRQIDIIYRERLLKSGRLSQEEYNALNTPEWEEKLEAYRRDLREGRVGGDWPTP